MEWGNERCRCIIIQPRRSVVRVALIPRTLLIVIAEVAPEIDGSLTAHPER